MFARIGIGGAKRLRAALLNAPAPFKHQRHASAADGLNGLPNGDIRPKAYCSISLGEHAATAAAGGTVRKVADGQYNKSPATSSSTPTHSDSGINLLQHATADTELHKRLAALWQMPSELLFERQQAVAKMWGPAGCGTTAHALWLLVRSPTLRHASEADLRQCLRQLHRLVSHTELDRRAVLMAVYKHPWILEAMASPQALPAAAAAAAAGQTHHQTPCTGWIEAKKPCAVGVSTAAAARQGPVTPHTWLQEWAAVVLELQQADYAEQAETGSSKIGLRLLPGFAAAAVRTYIFVAEGKQWLFGAGSRVADVLLKAVPLAPPAAEAGETANAAGSAPPTPRCSQALPSAPLAPTALDVPPPPPRQCPSDDPGSTAAGEVLQRLQQQQQQHLLLEQLLAACPHLVVLPPELLLARFSRLLSVVAGCADAAVNLVAHSPYLLLDYDDFRDGREEVAAVRQCYA